MIRDIKIDALFWSRGCFEIAEQRRDLIPKGFGVEVTDSDDRHQIGAIPVPVIVHQAIEIE